jgi:hypothetical protein
VTFFIGRCRSTRTLYLRDRHGALKIQRTRGRSTPRARAMRTCRARPWPRICSALNNRDPASGLTRRLSRSIRRAFRSCPAVAPVRRMTHSDRGFASVFVTEPEGLRLHMRSYGVRSPASQIAAIGTSRGSRMLTSRTCERTRSSSRLSTTARWTNVGCATAHASYEAISDGGNWVTPVTGLRMMCTSLGRYCPNSEGLVLLKFTVS